MRLSFQLGIAHEKASQGQNVTGFNTLVDEYNAWIRQHFGEDADLFMSKINVSTPSADSGLKTPFGANSDLSRFGKQQIYDLWGVTIKSQKREKGQYPRSAIHITGNDFQILGVQSPSFASWKGVNIPDPFSEYPIGVPPQFQRLVFAEALLVWPEFAEILFVCTGPAIWLKTAWPLLPLSCTGAVASQFKANAKKIMMHITVFRMLSPARFNPLDRIHKSNSDNIKIWYGIALGSSCTG